MLQSTSDTEINSNDILPRQPGKNHWSVPDGFNTDSGRISAFIHCNYQIGMHSHDFVELNIVLSGKGRHYLDSGGSKLTPGDAFAIPYQSKHGYRDDGDLTVAHILLHPAFMSEHNSRFLELPGFLPLFTMEPYFRQIGKNSHGVKLTGEVFERTVSLFEALVAECASTPADGFWLTEVMTLQLIITLCREYARQQLPGKETSGDAPRLLIAISRAVAYTHRKHGIGVTLDDLAQSACLERSYFCRTFRRLTGLTPMAMVRREVINEAKRRLLTPSMELGKLSAELGFCDAAHFSRAFHAIEGCSPSEYRRKLKN